MDKTVKIWNVLDEETEGVKGRKREISLVTSRDLGLVSHLALRRSRGIVANEVIGQNLHGSILA
jgi:hypothetical protein